MDRVETWSEGVARCEAWQGCDGDAPIELCTSDEGGHCWPGEAPLGVCFGLGNAMPDLPANEMMWEFFQKHSLP
jgi:polyhydroxybutyrate depolymerase